MEVKALFKCGATSHEFDDERIMSHDEALSHLYRSGTQRANPIFQHVVDIIACLYGEGELDDILREYSASQQVQELWQKLHPYYMYAVEIDRTIAELKMSGKLPTDYQSRYEKYADAARASQEAPETYLRRMDYTINDVDMFLYSAMCRQVLRLKDRIDFLVTTAFEYNCGELHGKDMSCKCESWVKFVERMFATQQHTPPFSFIPHRSGISTYLKGLLPACFTFGANSERRLAKWPAFNYDYKDYYKDAVGDIDGVARRESKYLLNELDVEHFNWLIQRLTTIAENRDNAGLAEKLEVIDREHRATRDELMHLIACESASCDCAWYERRVDFDENAWTRWARHNELVSFDVREPFRGEQERIVKESYDPTWVDAIETSIRGNLVDIGIAAVRKMMDLSESGDLADALDHDTFEEKCDALWSLFGEFYDCDRRLNDAIEHYVETGTLPKDFYESLSGDLSLARKRLRVDLEKDRKRNVDTWLEERRRVVYPILDIYEEMYRRVKLLGYKFYAICDALLPQIIKDKPKWMALESYLNILIAECDEVPAPLDAIPLCVMRLPEVLLKYDA